MFARVKKSGKYEYLQIVHNERVGAKVCQRTIATLGRLDVLQATGQVDGVVNSLAKYALHTAALSARREQRPATSIRIGPVGWRAQPDGGDLHRPDSEEKGLSLVCSRSRVYERTH